MGLTYWSRLSSWAGCDPKSLAIRRDRSIILVHITLELTGLSSIYVASTCGAKTLCHISFRDLSSTFFFRLTFCAMDSFHLVCYQCFHQPHKDIRTHRLNALSSLLRSICPGRCARRKPRKEVTGGGSTSPTSPSLSSSTSCVSGWYSERSGICYTTKPAGRKTE